LNFENVKIGNKEVGGGRPCFVVAEISCNHMGDIEKAYRLIEAAAKAGADAVKFQAFTLEEMAALRPSGICPPPWSHLTRDEIHQLARTPLEWFPRLFACARDNGVVAFSSFFGIESLLVLEAVECPAYKIAAPESENLGLLAMANGTGKPVIVSSPRKPWLGHADLALWCPPGYPQQNLHVCDLGNFADGLSYHGKNILLPSVAVACGAAVIEAHIMLRDTNPLDAAFSFTPGAFAKMISHIRQVEACL